MYSVNVLVGEVKDFSCRSQMISKLSLKTKCFTFFREFATQRLLNMLKGEDKISRRVQALNTFLPTRLQRENAVIIRFL